MPATIRPFTEKDTANVQQICIDTDPNFSPEETPLLLCLYCNYYIQQEPENCFVAADENDNAVGYILVAENEEKYREIYKKYYLETLRSLSESQYQRIAKEFSEASPFAQKYPAHLHIDISPTQQGQGLGPKLLNAALDNLRKKEVPGIMLGVGEGNTGAIRFYERYGFTRLAQLPGVIFYGYVL